MQHIWAPGPLPDLLTPVIRTGFPTLSSAMTVGPAFGETTAERLPEKLSAVLWCLIDVFCDSSTNKPLTLLTYEYLFYLLTLFT